MAKTAPVNTNEGDPKEPSFADFAAQRPDSELYRATATLLKGIVEQRATDIELLERIIVPVFVDLRAVPAAQLTWYFPKALADYRPLHALNASRLAMYFGRASGMDDAHIVQLGAIGLLYDTGMWLDSMPPVLEGRALTQDEMTKVETHPAQAAALLESLGDLDPLCALIAREHHERADGTGYPARSGAAAHHPYSRLFQIIDSFLGMIEPRTFRKALSPVEAIQRIAVQAQRGYYHLPTFRDWLKVTGVFPVGTFVELNTGEIAIVKSSGGDSLRRPKVSVIADELLDFRPKPLDIDLNEERAFEIKGAFTKFPKA